MGNSNSPTLIGASTDKTNGIYMDWTTNPPVLMGAAWNDYAEYRAQIDDIEPGYCVKSNDDGRVERTSEHMSICDGIVSDTFGFSIGKSDEYRTPLAVSGRVLAYCEGSRADYHAGDVVCASENGKVVKMTREEIKEYPDRIVGIVSEIP
jgi:fructose-1,6-bisphosphatase/inositol monophosphatase family enzyme